MSFSRAEHETSILFDDESSEATIYTCRKGWWVRLERWGLKPYRTQEFDGQKFARWYHVPKSWITCPRPPKKVPMTDEQRAAAAERLAAGRGRRTVPDEGPGIGEVAGATGRHS